MENYKERIAEMDKMCLQASFIVLIEKLEKFMEKERQLENKYCKENNKDLYILHMGKKCGIKDVLQLIEILL